jgi:hypothetical protein
MTIFDTVVREIEHAPEPLLREVLDFVRYLKSKLAHEQFDGAAASQTTLAKDWDRPEEDKAWAGL